MAVNIVRYAHDSRVRWGVLREGRIAPLPKAFETTGELVVEVAPETLSRTDRGALDVDGVQILAPITRNQQFVCQGANYRQHMIESGMDPDAKTYNMIFTKASSCIVAADSDVVRPRTVRLLDYEIELGVVLKRKIEGKVDVTDADLHEYVAALVIVNDYSARPQTQFYKGKSFRTFGPVGPVLCLLERDDFRLLRSLSLTLRVNGELRQDDTTANMVYGLAETLTELSTVQDFAAGDLLATGTPSGCALRVPSRAVQKIGAMLSEKTKWQIFVASQSKRRQYLQPGDVVEARIASADGSIDLGVQRNRIVAES
jgi:2,4-diketo-3-deoxy-L-fuconate hydrolase